MIGWLPITIINDHSDQENTQIITQQKVISGSEEGFECMSCKDFYPFATLNFPENATIFTNFKCYSCRKGIRNFF